MGLLYPLPISLEEKDFVLIDENQKTITLKSYGLPYIFWFYALAILIVYGFMMLGIASTLTGLLNSNDTINRVLAISFLAFSLSLPIVLVGFFFYQKVIILDNKNNWLKIFHRAYGLTYKKSEINLGSNFKLVIKHYLDSPNMARMNQPEEMRGFKNKGYFILEAVSGDLSYLIDRSSSKADLIKIQKLLVNDMSIDDFQSNQSP